MSGNGTVKQQNSTQNEYPLGLVVIALSFDGVECLRADTEEPTIGNDPL